MEKRRQPRQALHRRAQRAEAEVARLTRGLEHLGHVLRDEPELVEHLIRTRDYWATQALELDVQRAVRRGREVAPLAAPHGVPGERDPENVCRLFTPGEPAGTECMGDGHYLCHECAELVPYDEEDADE